MSKLPFKYDAARAMVAQLVTVDEVRELENKAEAVREYGRRSKDRGMEIDAAEIRLRAERRRGELLLEMKAEGALLEGRPGKGGKIGNGRPDSTVLASRETAPVERVTLKQLEITKTESSKAQALAAYDGGSFERLVARWRAFQEKDRGKVSLDVKSAEEKERKRGEREAQLAKKQAALPDKKYGLIYADPEWQFAPYSRKTGMDRAPENHYPTSTLIEIMKRDVGAIAAKDCILAMWATVPMLAEAFCVLDAWGFARFERDAATGFLTLDKSKGRYVSNAAWTKYWPGAGIGLGHWFRVDHEILLIATRGKPVAPPQGKQWRSIIDEPASKVHSQKPHVVYELFEKFWPTTRKIELNARNARPGWDAWGFEAPEAS